MKMDANEHSVLVLGKTAAIGRHWGICRGATRTLYCNLQDTILHQAGALSGDCENVHLQLSTTYILSSIAVVILRFMLFPPCVFPDSSQLTLQLMQMPGVCH